ncbi:MAG: peptidoglycan DD-metalloendopeptidase family protein [Patescibacteria group bacterium]
MVDTQVLGSDSGSTSKRDSIISYQVKDNDSLDSIAEKFDISKDTIRWANSISGNDVSAGDELLILPTTGILYYVERGDTLSDIAQKHDANGDEIIEFNDVESETDIKPGDQLIIPDGEKPAAPTIQQSAPSPARTNDSFSSVTYGTVTQGMHSGHKAIDVANNCGTPIYSGGSGTVTKTGFDPQMAGNYIWIDHGSFKALYAHLQGIHVTAGEVVSGGEQIGTMGNTGFTKGPTGCHIHFEVRGGANPFSNMQRGQTMQ